VEGNRNTTNEVISSSFLTTSQSNGEQEVRPKFVVYITGLQNMNPLLGGGTAVRVLLCLLRLLPDIILDYNWCYATSKCNECCANFQDFKKFKFPRL